MARPADFSVIGNESRGSWVRTFGSAMNGSTVFAGEDFDNSLHGLMARFPQAGRLDWIGLRPRSRVVMLTVQAAEASRDRGLVGDRHLLRGGGGKRQVTLIQAEHVPVIAALAGHEVTPALLRRNLVVSGINLLSLQKQRFAIGDVVLVGTSACAPCDKMEASIGEGTFQAMRGHGGICAKIERGGVIRRGDRVRLV